MRYTEIIDAAMNDPIVYAWYTNEASASEALLMMANRHHELIHLAEQLLANASFLPAPAFAPLQNE